MISSCIAFHQLSAVIPRSALTLLDLCRASGVCVLHSQWPQTPSLVVCELDWQTSASLELTGCQRLCVSSPSVSALITSAQSLWERLWNWTEGCVILFTRWVLYERAFYFIPFKLLKHEQAAQWKAVYFLKTYFHFSIKNDFMEIAAELSWIHLCSTVYHLHWLCVSLYLETSPVHRESLCLCAVEFWSPLWSRLQCYTHGAVRWGGLDDIRPGLLHPPVPHRDLGTTAGSQHLHPHQPSDTRRVLNRCKHPESHKYSL